jgi:hypothetical protein
MTEEDNSLDQSFTAMDLEKENCDSILNSLEQSIRNSVGHSIRNSVEDSIRSTEVKRTAWGDVSNSESSLHLIGNHTSESNSYEATPLSYSSVVSGEQVPDKMSILAAIDAEDTDYEQEFEEEEEEEGEEEEKDKEKDHQQERICKFFNTRRGCNKGDMCTFKHERQVCAFFASAQGCTGISDCPFIHDLDATPSVQLKPCPNEDCKNMCIGKQCMQCHSVMHSRKKLKVTLRRERSPNRRDRSPIRRDRSPIRRERSPGRRERSPNRRGGSPNNLERYPNRRERSPSRGYRSYRDNKGYRGSRENHTSRPYRSRATAGNEYPRVESRVRACPENGCRNTCIGRRCRECHLRSIKTRNHKPVVNGYHSDEGGHQEEK